MSMTVVVTRSVPDRFRGFLAFDDNNSLGVCNLG